ncbi:hypothetical protein HOY80DRAFT_998912 [Tuber brumale]|nr:hypothetical protein HOY80DRAFT_998912 [Tuber brumale]
MWGAHGGARKRAEEYSAAGLRRQRGSESRVDDHEESVANHFEEDEILDDLAKLANLPEIISSVPSPVKSPNELLENDLDEWNTPNEHNFTTATTSDKATMESLLPTITNPEVVESLKMVAGKKQAKSSQSVSSIGEPVGKIGKEANGQVRSGSSLRELKGHGRPRDRNCEAETHEKKVTVLSAALPTSATELPVTVSGIVEAFTMVSGEPIEGLDELKPNRLSVVEVLKCTAALRLGLDLMS